MGIGRLRGIGREVGVGMLVRRLEVRFEVRGWRRKDDGKERYEKWVRGVGIG